jgi:hypothetical protein
MTRKLNPQILLFAVALVSCSQHSSQSEETPKKAPIQSVQAKLEATCVADSDCEAEIAVCQYLGVPPDPPGPCTQGFVTQSSSCSCVSGQCTGTYPFGYQYDCYEPNGFGSCRQGDTAPSYCHLK